MRLQPYPPKAFSDLCGVAVDHIGNVYFTDINAHAIYRMAPSHEVTLLAGKPFEQGAADGESARARFNSPCGIGVDAKFNVVVADWGNQEVRRITPQGLVSTLAGQPKKTRTDAYASSVGLFSAPVAVAVESSGAVLVLDAGQDAVKRVLTSGEVKSVVELPHHVAPTAVRNP
jgi:streptogramin lyase